MPFTLSTGTGTNVQASHGFAGLCGKPTGDLGMLTVYKYGFEIPKPPEPSTPWLTYALVAVAGWWAWTKWGKGTTSTRAANPRRRRGPARRHNPRVRFRVGDRVSVPWFPQGKGRGNRVRARVLQIVGGGRAVVQFPSGNLNNVPTGGLRRVK